MTIAQALKTYGKIRFAKIKLRLTAIAVADTLEELRHHPGNWPELKGDRKGQWACDLDQPYRLIFEPQKKPIPTDNSGKYNWTEIKAVEIIEIINYHKER